jgi:hypothetical protein
VFKPNSESIRLQSLKDAVIAMYGEGLSTCEIGRRTDFNQQTIANLLHRNGVDVSIRNRQWLKEITPEQRSIINGTLMGDGSLGLYDTHVNAHLDLKHSLVQNEWLYFKFNKLRNLFNTEPYVGEIKCKKCGKLHKYIEAQSRSHPLLTEIYHQYYTRPDSECTDSIYKKRITPELLKNLEGDDLALMVWFCDDGSYTGRGKLPCLYAGAVTSAEYQLVLTFLVNQDFDPELVPGKDKNCVRFDLHNRLALRQRIGRLVPTCMAYKSFTG